MGLETPIRGRSNATGAGRALPGEYPEREQRADRVVVCAEEPESRGPRDRAERGRCVDAEQPDQRQSPPVGTGWYQRDHRDPRKVAERERMQPGNGSEQHRQQDHTPDLERCIVIPGPVQQRDRDETDATRCSTTIDGTPPNAYPRRPSFCMCSPATEAPWKFWPRIVKSIQCRSARPRRWSQRRQAHERSAGRCPNPDRQCLPLPLHREVNEQQSGEELDRARESRPDTGSRDTALRVVHGGRHHQRQQDRLDVQVVKVVVNGEDHDGEGAERRDPAPAPSGRGDAPHEAPDPQGSPQPFGERHTDVGERRERNNDQQRKWGPPRALRLRHIVDGETVQQEASLGDLGRGRRRPYGCRAEWRARRRLRKKRRTPSIACG